jgi:DNA (cytosine-5)-methyltransferase 1
MVKIYTCEKCGKTFKQKGHYTKHLQRKTPCDNVVDSKIEKIVEEKVNKVVDEKIKNLKNIVNVDDNNMDKEYTIVETFVGCGGSHLGFKKNNFKPIFVNDIWKTSLDTLSNNNNELGEEQLICKDINKLCQENLLEKYNIDSKSLTLLIGGVVCKGFSLAGVRNPYDERNYLYISQLKLVEQFMPKISIIENVPGMENMKILHKNNYAPVSKKMQLNNLSEEVIKLCSEIDNIIINHKSNRGQIIAINKKLSNEKSEEEKLIIQNEKNKLEEEKNKLDNSRKKYEEKLSKYKYSVVDDIIERYNELGYKIYKKKLKVSNYGGYTNRVRLIIVAVRNDIEKEWEWPTITNDDGDDDLPNLYTVKDALDLLDDEINSIENDKDNIPMNHKKSTIEKFKKITHEKKSGGFSSRGTSQRLDYNKPAPTLVPGHSSFQIHPEYHRSITVREGATITGFPIDYKFSGSHSDRCMQIGNAIPVHLADAIAKSVIKILDE